MGWAYDRPAYQIRQSNDTGFVFIESNLFQHLAATRSVETTNSEKQQVRKNIHSIFLIESYI